MLQYLLMPLTSGQNHRIGPVVECAALLAAAGLYIHAAAPTVTTTGDHGELALACLNLSSGHPPGYPLFVFLGKAFATCVPLGGAAFRLNLLSALMAALAVWMVVRTVTRISGHLSAGVIAGGCLACSPTFLSQAVITEVYSTQIFFTAVLIHLWLQKGERSRKTRLFTWFFCGISVFHHYTVAPLAILAMYRSRPRDARDWFWLPFCAVLGATPFLLLPLAAGRGLPWGTPDRFPGVLLIMLRKQYWLLPTPPRSFLLTVRQMFYIFQVICEDISPFALVLAAGTVLLLLGTSPHLRQPARYRLPEPLTRVLLLLLVFGPPVALISNFPLTPGGKEAVRVLLLPLLASICVFVGLACAKLIDITGRQRLAGGILCAVILFVTGSGTSIHAPSRTDSLAYDYARNLLKSAPDHSVIVASGGNEVFPLWFVRHSQPVATATIVDFKLLSQEWYRRFLSRENALTEVPQTFIPRTIPRSSRELDREILSAMLKARKDRYYLATPTAWPEFRDDKPDSVRGMLFPLSPPGKARYPAGVELEQLQLRALLVPADKHPLENRIFYPRYSLSLAIAAEALYAGERFREALEWAETAYSLNPGSAIAGAILGSIYLQEGWFDKAESMLASLRKKTPDSPHILYNLGLLYTFQNRPRDAREIWGRLSRLYPGYQGVEENLKKLDTVSSTPH